MGDSCPQPRVRVRVRVRGKVRIRVRGKVRIRVMGKVRTTFERRSGDRTRVDGVCDLGGRLGLR